MILALLACKSDRPKKNDEIAACTSTGGRWVEGGCNDNGHCEKTAGMGPDESDGEDDGEDFAETDDERTGEAGSSE
jgi:hypothetical protein